MDRGTWWATVHWVTRVGHNLVTKPPPPRYLKMKVAACSFLQEPSDGFYYLSSKARNMSSAEFKPISCKLRMLYKVNA